jgi:uncharacterized protein YegP (UPF0339 family)
MSDLPDIEVQPFHAEVRHAENGQWYFTLVANNNRVLATGETYHNKSDAIKTAQMLSDVVVIHDREDEFAYVQEELPFEEQTDEEVPDPFAGDDPDSGVRADTATSAEANETP